MLKTNFLEESNTYDKMCGIETEQSWKGYRLGYKNGKDLIVTQNKV